MFKNSLLSFFGLKSCYDYEKENIDVAIIKALENIDSFSKDHVQVEIIDKNTKKVKVNIWDNRYCDSLFKEGLYISYSLSNNNNTLFLSINQGRSHLSSEKRLVIAKKYRQIAKSKGLQGLTKFKFNNMDFDEALFVKRYGKKSLSKTSEGEWIYDLINVYSIYCEFCESYKINILDEIKATNDEKEDNQSENSLSVIFKKIIDSYKDGKYGSLSSDDENILKNKIISILKSIETSKMNKKPYSDFPHNGIQVFIEKEIEKSNRIKIYIGHEKCNNFSINDGLFLLYSFDEYGSSIRLSLSIGNKSISNEERSKIGKSLNVTTPVGFLKNRGNMIGDAILRIGYGSNSLDERWLERDLKNLYLVYLVQINHYNNISIKLLNKNPLNNENKLFKYLMHILDHNPIDDNIKNDIIRTIFDILNDSKSFPSLTNNIQAHIEEINEKNQVKIYLWDNQYFDSTFNQGIYLTYLFNRNSKTFSLYIGQGKIYPSSNTREIIANDLKHDISVKRKYGKNMSDDDLTEFIENGAKGFVIAYKQYEKGNVNVELLVNDLKILYKLYMELCESYKLKLDELNSMIFYEYLISRGYFFDKKIIENYLLSLKVKSFAILTGNSGTGKTKLSQLFAEYLENDDNNATVPVGANWTENRNIVGYYNILTKNYQHTQSLDLILNAQKNTDDPYFLILDEMNLSHVERYFSDILSSMESKEPIPLHKSSEVEDVPKDLTMPNNLFIVGTVNVDETTYMFSPKVLDRANVLEFKTFKDISIRDYIKNNSPEMEFEGDVDYLENPLSDRGLRENILSVVNKHFRDIKYNSINEANETEDIENEKAANSYVLLEISKELTWLNDCLKSAGFEFGYRTVNEIISFMYVAWKYEGKQEVWDNWRRYFDAQILQKILPKLHGSQMILGKTLDNLLTYCLGLESLDDIPDLKDIDDKYPYPDSARKLMQMKKVLEKQRYVSFIN